MVRYSWVNEEVLKPFNAFQGCGRGSEREGKAEKIMKFKLTSIHWGATKRFSTDGENIIWEY